jgi:hypothetical protein
MNLGTVYKISIGLIGLQILPELITFSLSIITFSRSRTTDEVSHVAAGEHMSLDHFIGD